MNKSGPGEEEVVGGEGGEEEEKKEGSTKCMMNWMETPSHSLTHSHPMNLRWTIQTRQLFPLNAMVYKVPMLTRKGLSFTHSLTP